MTVLRQRSKLTIILFPLVCAVYLLVAAEVQAAAVYYSVGQSASDLKTGTPTVTITSGAAVFSAAQTGNIGVGDRVTYNTNVVAYIAAKTNADQQHWTLVTKLGAAPADVTDATVNSITREYTSLATALAGASDSTHLNTVNLVTGGYQLNFPCYYDSGSDDGAGVDGWTTGASNYIKIYTPYDTSTEANQSQRHDGKWNAGKFNFYVPAYDALDIYDDFVRVEGIQANLTGNAGFHAAILVNNQSVSNDIRISDNILTFADTHDPNYYPEFVGMWLGDTDLIARVWNNIIYNARDDTSVSGAGIRIEMASTAIVYNNTVYNSVAGIDENYAVNPVIAKNNLAYGNDTNYTGDFVSNSTNNLSGPTLSDAPGLNPQNAKTVAFMNTTAGSENLHLANYDVAARDRGADLSADGSFSFSTDIDNASRPDGSAWDIGADELVFVQPAQIYYSVGQNTNNHCGPSGNGTSCGNVSITSGLATFTAAQSGANLGVGDELTAGGNKYYLSSKTDTTHWNVVTKLGALPADLGSTAVTSITHAFASLEGAVDANTATGAFDASHLNTKNLATGNYVLNIPCYYDSGPDGVAIVQGWTTGLNHSIRVYTPFNVATEVNQSQRHDGKWNTGRYRIEKDYTVTYGLRINNANVKIDGLQLENTDNSNDLVIPNGDNNTISHSILRGTGVNDWNYRGIVPFYDSGSGTTYIFNNIIYGFGRCINWYYEDGTGYVYNNTLYDCGETAVYAQQGTSLTVFAKNNVVQGSASGLATTGTWGSGTDYNISGNTNDAPSPSYRPNLATTVSFVSTAAGSEDFHLASSDAGALNHGTSLSTDTYLPFSTDVDGDNRDSYGAWDIGADEFKDLPIRSDASPSGALAVNTTTTVISLTTGTSATCKYGTAAGTAYASIADTFTITGGTTHSAVVTGLTNDTSYTYYVRCQDGVGNTNAADYPITFSVQSSGALSFVNEYETAWFSATSPKTTANFDVQTGDILVAYAVSEGDAIVIGTPPGGTLAGTWSLRQTLSTASYTYVRLWTMVAGANQTGVNVSFSVTGSGNFGGDVLQFRGSSGVGVTNQAQNSTGDPSLTLTGVSANSAIVMVNGDWSAVVGTPAYYAADAGSFTPKTEFADGASFGGQGGYYANAGATGNKTVGVTDPNGMKWSLAAVEVKAGGAADSFAPTITSISSTNANGTYGTGAGVNVTVTFSEAVTSTGSVTVNLNTAPARSCTFTVTNSATGSCTYTVQAGDYSSRLNVSSVSGTIKDQADNAMTNYSPTLNITDLKNIIITSYAGMRTQGSALFKGNVKFR